ncbi:flagellar protein FlaG [Bacillus sp. 22-7]|uniref:flagellar protein FlaG n=1 Tax=Bacillus sp. 22-7 TaxID=2709707 RepID=UPI0013D5F822|nr:flagellar protein FlaG [Bacillus sp. 22-7]
MINEISSQKISLTSRTANTILSNEFSKNQKNVSTQLFFQSRETKKGNQVVEVVDSMNKFLQASHTSLKFVLHEELNEYYVTLVDDVTQEVVKEIPSKKMLDMYAAMTEFVGLMVDKKI